MPTIATVYLNEIRTGDYLSVTLRKAVKIRGHYTYQDVKVEGGVVHVGTEEIGPFQGYLLTVLNAKGHIEMHHITRRVAVQLHLAYWHEFNLQHGNSLTWQARVDRDLYRIWMGIRLTQTHLTADELAREYVEQLIAA